MTHQPLERPSVRAMIKWAKAVGREKDGAPSRTMRRAQLRLMAALSREAAAPTAAVNDAALIALLGESGRQDPEHTRRLSRPDGAVETVDAILALLTPPDAEESLQTACRSFRDYLKHPEGEWLNYRAVLHLQLAVWHHMGVDPSSVVLSLLETVKEDGPPPDPDAAVRSAIAACLEAAHDELAASALDKHGGDMGAVRESVGLAEDADVHLRTAFPPAGTPEPDPDRIPPRAGDVVEPTLRLISVATNLADDTGDVLEHMDADSAPAGTDCSKVHWRVADIDVIIEDNLLDVVMRCTCYRAGSDPDPATAECVACGHRDCPHGEPLHYHHDGCPECIRHEENTE